MTENGISIRIACWLQDAPAIRMVRIPVFVEEQGVPPELEWDEHEAKAVHLIAEDHKGKAVGTARLLASGQIGRLAVLKPWRGRGIGKALLSRALEISKGEGLRRPFLNAQVPAMGFYRQMGFLEQGEVFMEAGITHRKMEWRG